MSQATTPRSFYTERIPRQWNRALEAKGEAGEAERRVYEGMAAVDATLRVIVEGDDGGTFHLNIVGGRMSPGQEAAHPPFLTLVHDRAAFEALEREAGDSALGFLGGLAGLAGAIHLTRERLANLAGMKGALYFELTGEGGFSLLTHFGDGPIPAPEEARCRISVDADAYRDLRSGQANPHDAFLSGKIHVEGDMQMAMQLALAVMSPD
jgi:putative sterol carrier protein